MRGLGGSMRLLNSHRRREQIFVVCGGVLIFAAAIAVMLYVMK